LILGESNKNEKMRKDIKENLENGFFDEETVSLNRNIYNI